MTSLLLHDADINKVDSQEQTALDWAAYWDKDEFGKKVLEKWEGDPGKLKKRLICLDSVDIS